MGREQFAWQTLADLLEVGQPPLVRVIAATGAEAPAGATPPGQRRPRRTHRGGRSARRPRSDTPSAPPPETGD